MNQLASSLLLLLIGLALNATAPPSWAAKTGAEQAADKASANAPSQVGAAGGEAGEGAAEGEEAVEEAPVVIPPLVLEGDKLQEEIDGLRERLGVVQKQLKAAEGEEARVLEHQVAEIKVDYLETIHNLTQNVLAQEKAELDASGVRARLESEVKGLAQAIVEHIDIGEKRLRQYRKERITSDPGEELKFEEKIVQEIGWIESLYRAYAGHLKNLEAAGIPAEDIRKDVMQRLSALADRLAGRIKLTSDQLQRLEKRAIETPDDAAVQGEIRALTRRKKHSTTAIAIVSDLMDTVGLDSSPYRQLLIKATGEVTADVFKGRVALGLAEEALESLREWARKNGPGFLFKLFSFVIILVLFRAIAGVTRKVVKRSMTGENARSSVLVQNMALSLAGRGIMLIGILVALSQLGIELAPLLTGLGIAGFIVGFALQDSLANFAAGIMILGYRPYDVGDLIEAGGVFGSVSHMSLVSTTILTIDNQTLIVPNGKIWGDVIKNITNQDIRRIDMKFHTAHSDDVDDIERILNEIVKEHPKVLADPPPTVTLHKLRENSLEFVVRPWVDTKDYWEVHWDVTREVKHRFDAAGITTPHSQRDIHIVPAPASD